MSAIENVIKHAERVGELSVSKIDAARAELSALRARVADLTDDNREAHEAIETLRAECKRLAGDNDRLRIALKDALSINTTDGMTASEWVERTGKAERERDALAEKVKKFNELHKLSTELVNSLGYYLDIDNEPQECLKAELALGDWLTANDAPTPEAGSTE
jgi:chromosome segregation ATPase